MSLTRWIHSICLSVMLVVPTAFALPWDDSPYRTPTPLPTNTPPPAPPPLKIGAVLSLSGLLKSKGEAVKESLQMAVDEVNTLGGINNSPVILEVRDSEGDGKKAASIVSELVVTSHVDIIIGDVDPQISAAMAPVALARRVPVLALTSADGWTAGNVWVFGLLPSPSQFEPYVEEFLAKNSNVRTAAILCTTDDRGSAYADAWRVASRAKGISIVEEVCSSPRMQDLRVDLIKAKAASPDLLFLVGPAEIATRLMKSLSFSAKLFATNEVVDAIALRGVDLSLLRGVSFADWRMKEPFIAQFRSRFNRVPIAEDAVAYDAIKAIVSAAKGSTLSISSALRAAKYEGSLCTFDFSSQSPCKATSYVKTIVDK